MAETLLTVDKLSFSYGSRQLFKDLSFTIKEGAVSCLLGPNGCGKTTLIDCILGNLKAESGDIFHGKRSVKSLSSRELALRTAYVPQHHEKHFPFSVSDVILMGRTAHFPFPGQPGKDDKEKVDILMNQLGLSELSGRDYTQLSGGETQMVLILRALIQEAPLIVMDEPTSHLDYKNEFVMLDRIVDLVEHHKKGILLSTHSPNQAFFLENLGIEVQVMLMNDKGDLLIGSPGEVLTVKNMEAIYDIRTVQVSGTDPLYNSLVPLEIIKRKEL